MRDERSDASTQANRYFVNRIVDLSELARPARNPKADMQRSDPGMNQSMCRQFIARQCKRGKSTNWSRWARRPNFSLFSWPRESGPHSNHQ